MILSIPLHLFRMMQIAEYIIIMLKPWLFEKKVWDYLRSRSRHWFGKTGWVSGTKQGTQSSLWTFVRHHCFMEYICMYIYIYIYIYIYNERHGKCMYKGWERRTATLAWMPRGLLGCTDVHSINSVTNKYIIIHPCILSRKNSTINSVISIMMIRVQTNNLILISISRACEQYWIQVWCGRFLQWAPTAEVS